MDRTTCRQTRRGDARGTASMLYTQNQLKKLGELVVVGETTTLTRCLHFTTRCTTDSRSCVVVQRVVQPVAWRIRTLTTS